MASKFKVGDKVVIIKNIPGFSATLKGTVCVVKTPSFGYHYGVVQLPDGSTRLLTDDELDFTKLKEKQIMSKFKAGDKVVVVKNAVGYENTPKGTVGVVEDRAEGDYYTRVNFPDRGFSHLFEEDELELVAPKFKVGDKVRTTIPITFSAAARNIALGAEGVVCDVDNGWAYKVKFEGIYGTVGFNNGELVPAPAATPKFKVGDKVKIKILAGSFKPGTEGIISSVHPSDPYPYTINLKSFMTNVFNFGENELELVPAPAATPKFKVGDKVMLLSPAGFMATGDKGVIVDARIGHHKVKFNSVGNTSLWCYDKELELDCSPVKFKVGDKIRATQHIPVYIEKGALGVVKNIITGNLYVVAFFGAERVCAADEIELDPGAAPPKALTPKEEFRKAVAEAKTAQTAYRAAIDKMDALVSKDIDALDISAAMSLLD